LNPEYEKGFGKNIGELRKKVGMTQELLAAKLQLKGSN